jgi:hypothetical protein
MSHSSQENLILEVLASGETLTLEQVIAEVPELSWSQLFQAVDALSRHGHIALRRRGFQYELSLRTQRQAMDRLASSAV